MSDPVQKLENALNEELQRGNILEAFEKFYSEDVEMQENALTRVAANQQIANVSGNGPYSG